MPAQARDSGPGPGLTGPGQVSGLTEPLLLLHRQSPASVTGARARAASSGSGTLGAGASDGDQPPHLHHSTLARHDLPSDSWPERWLYGDWWAIGVLWDSQNNILEFFTEIDVIIWLCIQDKNIFGKFSPFFQNTTTLIITAALLIVLISGSGCEWCRGGQRSEWRREECHERGLDWAERMQHTGVSEQRERIHLMYHYHTHSDQHYTRGSAEGVTS